MDETPVCRHFTSCLETHCSAGVRFRDVIQGEKGRMKFWPCVHTGFPYCEHRDIPGGRPFPAEDEFGNEQPDWQAPTWAPGLTAEDRRKIAAGEIPF